MTQALIGPNPVMVLAADPFAFNDPSVFEFGNHPLDRTLRDPNLQGDVAQYHRGIAREKHQHVRVIRQEGPLGTD